MHVLWKDNSVSMSQDLLKIILPLVSAMNCCRLYPSHHPSVVLHTTEALGNLRLHMVQNKVVIDVEDHNTLRINGFSVAADTAEAKKLFVKLRQRGVARLIFGKGINADELMRFFLAFSTSGGTGGPYENIVVSTLKKTETAGQDSVAPDAHEIASVKKLYREIRIYKNVDMSNVDAIVGGIIAGIRKNRNLSHLMVPETGGEDYLFAHAFNVALLSVLQADYIGLGNALLHDIGFAALLHDIGKTLLPKEVEDRQDSLDEERWALMKKHPVYGAALLSSMKRIPGVAAIVAFEHHMKYDGTGYPETRRHAKKLHLVSQIVGIADWYCALSSDLAHRKPLGHAVILGLLDEMKGKEFSPVLVDNFVRAVSADR